MFRSEIKLYDIFKAITPIAIQELPVVKVAMKIFCENLEKNSTIAKRIISLYDTNSSSTDSEHVKKAKDNIKTGLFNFYTKSLYEAVQKMAGDSRIQKILKKYSYDSAGIYNAVNDIITSEYFSSHREFSQTVGTEKAIHYIYAFAKYLETGDFEDDLTIEKKTPFYMLYEGSLAKDIFGKIVYPMVHPLGWAYLYTTVFSVVLRDYYGITTNYTYTKFELIDKEQGLYYIFIKNDDTESVLEDFRNRINPKTYRPFTESEISQSVNIIVNKELTDYTHWLLEDMFEQRLWSFKDDTVLYYDGKYEKWYLTTFPDYQSGCTNPLQTWGSGFRLDSTIKEDVTFEYFDTIDEFLKDCEVTRYRDTDRKVGDTMIYDYDMSKCFRVEGDEFILYPGSEENRENTEKLTESSGYDHKIVFDNLYSGSLYIGDKCHMYDTEESVEDIKEYAFNTEDYHGDVLAVKLIPDTESFEGGLSNIEISTNILNKAKNSYFTKVVSQYNGTVKKYYLHVEGLGTSDDALSGKILGFKSLDQNANFTVDGKFRNPGEYDLQNKLSYVSFRTYHYDWWTFDNGTFFSNQAFVGAMLLTLTDCENHKQSVSIIANEDRTFSYDFDLTNMAQGDFKLELLASYKMPTQEYTYWTGNYLKYEIDPGCTLPDFGRPTRCTYHVTPISKKEDMTGYYKDLYIELNDDLDISDTTQYEPKRIVESEEIVEKEDGTYEIIVHRKYRTGTLIGELADIDELKFANPDLWAPDYYESTGMDRQANLFNDKNFMTHGYTPLSSEHFAQFRAFKSINGNFNFNDPIYEYEGTRYGLIIEGNDPTLTYPDYPTETCFIYHGYSTSWSRTSDNWILTNDNYVTDDINVSMEAATFRGFYLYTSDNRYMYTRDKEYMYTSDSTADSDTGSSIVPSGRSVLPSTLQIYSSTSTKGAQYTITYMNNSAMGILTGYSTSEEAGEPDLIIGGFNKANVDKLNVIVSSDNYDIGFERKTIKVQEYTVLVNGAKKTIYGILLTSNLLQKGIYAIVLQNEAKTASKSFTIYADYLLNQ